LLIRQGDTTVTHVIVDSKDKDKKKKVGFKEEIEEHQGEDGKLCLLIL